MAVRSPFESLVRRLIGLVRRRRSPELPKDWPDVPVTPDDIQRAEELVQKYGWDHLRDKA